MVLDSKLDEFGRRLEGQFFHGPIFVKCNRPRSDMKNISYFLHGLSLGQQLHHLALTRRQRLGPLPALGVANETLLHSLGDIWGDIGPSLQRLANRME